MVKKYIFELDAVEEAELVSPDAKKIKRANILLLKNNGKANAEIDELLPRSWLPVLRTRLKFVEGGLSFALNELEKMRRGMENNEE